MGRPGRTLNEKQKINDELPPIVPYRHWTFQDDKVEFTPPSFMMARRLTKRTKTEGRTEAEMVLLQTREVYAFTWDDRPQMPGTHRERFGSIRLKYVKRVRVCGCPVRRESKVWMGNRRCCHCWSIWPGSSVVVGRCRRADCHRRWLPCQYR